MAFSLVTIAFLMDIQIDEKLSDGLKRFRLSTIFSASFEYRQAGSLNSAGCTAVAVTLSGLTL